MKIKHVLQSQPLLTYPHFEILPPAPEGEDLVVDLPLGLDVDQRPRGQAVRQVLQLLHVLHFRSHLVTQARGQWRHLFVILIYSRF